MSTSSTFVIDWARATPWSALAGGALIGLSCAALILACGRVAGISGILSGALEGPPIERAWRVNFLLGMLLSPWLYTLLGGATAEQLGGPSWRLGVAGLLVGFGSRMASGCTSGHGVCGIARLSRRSLMATATFLTAGFLTVLVLRHF
jgi:uncharacterized membrane protein YedE/YeeE